MAKKFFYVCGGLLMLALAYHLGATTATAQAPGNPVVSAYFSNQNLANYAVTSNGDVYVSTNSGQSYSRIGGVFGGAPVMTQEQSWGQVKARYR